MSEWESFIEQANAEARKILGRRNRNPKDEGIYVFAWWVLDYSAQLHEATLHGHIDVALNSFFRVCDAYQHMIVLRDVPEYRGWVVSTTQLTRDTNRGVKGNRSDRKATEKGAPALNRKKGKTTLESLKTELQKRNWKPDKRGIAQQLAGVNGIPENVVHVRRLLSNLKTK